VLLDAAWRPKFVVEWKSGRLSDLVGKIGHSLSWDESALNPKNRANSLKRRNNAGSPGWRIDGATICGTRFFVVPHGLLGDSDPNPPPLAIFAILPDQTTFPPALRMTLDAAASVPLRSGTAISKLGISRHLIRALEMECARSPEILQRYRSLPFGSVLVFGNVTSNPADMRITIVPNHVFERKTLSLTALAKLWPEIPREAWPPEVDVFSLRLLRQIHDTVSLVSSPEFDGVVAFKSAIGSVNHMYHELRFLLTIPPHPYIMPRPLGIVTKRSAFGGKRGVVGFLLPYFPAGSIRDILPARQRAGTLPNHVKLRWCRQVTAALIHLRETAGAFYSDLRPDNVLLLLDEQGEENVVLCDFEQRGNWHEWCAPEVLFRQYAENIRSSLAAFPSGSSSSSSSSSAPFARLLAGYAPPWDQEDNSESAVAKANRAWFLLPKAAQEKATVYTLGLFIYTVFEGLSNVRGNIANQWPIDPEVEFPAIRNTPEVVKDLINRCTDGAMEEEEEEDGEEAGLEEGGGQRQRTRVVRKGGYLYPEGQLDLEQGTAATAAAVVAAALSWWSGELERAERFLESEEWRNQRFGENRPSLIDVARALEEMEQSWGEGELD